MDAIRTYVKGAFAGVAQTPAAIEQQQELIANMEEKLRDLVESGKSETEALGITLAEAGDLTELASEFPTLEEFASKPPTAQVRVAEKRLLERIAGVGLAAALLAGFGGFIGAVRGVDSSAFLLLFGALCVGAWRVWKSLGEYAAADTSETAEVLVREPHKIRDAWLKWGGIWFASFVLNVSAGMGGGFWAWIAWAVAIVLPAEAMASWLLVRNKIVTVERLVANRPGMTSEVAPPAAA